MRYAYFENGGRVSLSINDSTISQLPAGAVALTKAQWEERFDLLLVDGQLILRPLLPGDDHGEERPAESIHAEKVALINSACESAITEGFWSEALGDRYRYESQLEDQLNLQGAVLLGAAAAYPCRDVAGVREFRLHRAEQLNEVSNDFTLYKLQLLQHANALKQALDQALASGDVAALEAVTWGATP